MNLNRKMDIDDRKKENVKKCRRCSKEFPLKSQFFRRNKDSQDGFCHFCKKCSSEIGKAHYIKFIIKDRYRKGAIGVRCPLWNLKCGICNYSYTCRRIDWEDNDDIPFNNACNE